MAKKQKHKIVKKGEQYHVMDEQGNSVSQHDSLPEAQDALIGLHTDGEGAGDNSAPQGPNFQQNQKDQGVLDMIQNTLNSRLSKAKDKKKKKDGSK